MKNFALFLKDMDKGIINGHNPNINTVGNHRKVIQYKQEHLRRGIYQPWRMRFRKNRLYTPHRYIHKITNKITEDSVTLLPFQHFLLEAYMNQSNPPIDVHMKKKLYSTVHSKERDEERNSHEDMVKHIFRKTVEHVKQHGAKYGKTGHFVVTSKKHNRSIVLDYRPEKGVTNDKSSHFMHISTFPEGEHYANAKSTHIHVENFEINEPIFLEVE